MLRKSTLILIIVIAYLPVYQSDRIEAGETAVKEPDIRAGVIEYLRQQNPPELKAVR